MVERIDKLTRETQREPFAGVGKPEPLEHALSGFWSRRTTGEHRWVGPRPWSNWDANNVRGSADVHATANGGRKLCFIGQQDHFCRLLSQRDKRLISGRRKPTIYCRDTRETDNDNVWVRVFAGKGGQLFATKDKFTSPGGQCFWHLASIFSPHCRVLYCDVADNICAIHVRGFQGRLSREAQRAWSATRSFTRDGWTKGSDAAFAVFDIGNPIAFRALIADEAHDTRPRKIQIAGTSPTAPRRFATQH